MLKLQLQGVLRLRTGAYRCCLVNHHCAAALLVHIKGLHLEYLTKVTASQAANSRIYPRAAEVSVACCILFTACSSRTRCPS